MDGGERVQAAAGARGGTAPGTHVAFDDEESVQKTGSAELRDSDLCVGRGSIRLSGLAGPRRMASLQLEQLYRCGGARLAGESFRRGKERKCESMSFHGLLYSIQFHT